TVTAVADYNGQQYKNGFVTIGYPGLRPYNLYSAATYRTSGVDVKIAPGLSVGYIEGTGDTVPESLENLGIKVHFLSAQDISSGDLQKYSVIVMGVRTYAARPELATNNNRLLDYVKKGGVVVVQYQTGQYDHEFGPYPYSLGNPEKVVVEDGEAQVLDPKSPTMNWPNQITKKDFDGWVEERGHGFMHTWDAHYEAPLEMHDEGQEPQKGGLLFTRYGKGAYVYMALALYRELPEGVPGSYRIFANLLSLPKNPGLAGAAKAAGAKAAKKP
ncbi:MAG: PIG-L family deacetylase, partial [Bryobacteraceae bacterium]